MFNILENRQQAEHAAKQAAQECGSIIRTWQGYKAFTLAKLVLDWKVSRKSSRGGWYAAGPGINIAMSGACTFRTSPYRIYEYKSFDLDPVIGGFFARDPELAIQHVVCHEMAHAAQFYADRVLGDKIDRPHGDSFKRPYKALRQQYLNTKIPQNQQQLKQEYDVVVTNILAGR